MHIWRYEGGKYRVLKSIMTFLATAVDIMMIMEMMFIVLKKITVATQKKLRLEIISKNEGYSYVLGNIIIVITTMISSK